MKKSDLWTLDGIYGVHAPSKGDQLKRDIQMSDNIIPKDSIFIDSQGMHI